MVCSTKTGEMAKNQQKLTVEMVKIGKNREKRGEMMRNRLN